MIRITRESFSLSSYIPERHTLKLVRGLIIVLTMSLVTWGCAGTGNTESTAEANNGGWIGNAPPGWNLTGPDAKRYAGFADHETINSGNSSVSISSTIAGNKHFGAISQTIHARDYAGERVRFRAYLRTNDVDQRAGLWMRADSQFRSMLAFDNMANRKIRGSTNWTEYAIVVDVPENADYILFGALLIGRGQLWIDDCSLELVSKKIKTTSLPGGLGNDRKFDMSRTINDGPLNMGFED